MERSLLVRAPGEPIREFEIGEGTMVAGRDATCEIVIASRFVSRRHFEVENMEDGLLVRDLGGSNPILVNGKAVMGEQLLRHGDLVRIADVTIEVREEQVEHGGTEVFDFNQAVAEREALQKVTRSIWGQQHLGPGGTVSIMFTDIENSTPLVAALGDGAARHLIQLHNAVLQRQFERHRGYVAKRIGDGFLAVFASARDAVGCAVEIQRAVSEMNSEEQSTTLLVRIGIHVGEVLWDKDDIFGTAINYAARVSSQAAGAEIVISALMREIAAPTGEFHFDDAREVELKGFEGMQRVFRVRWAGEQTSS